MHDMYYDTPYLMHHGIKGMRWGVRRYQNRDGSLTSAGRNRYDSNTERGGLSKRAMRKAERQKRRLAEQQALDKWLSGKKLSDSEKRVLLGKRHQSDKDIAEFDKYTSGKIHQKTVNDYNRSKKPLTAAQKAERKRKLAKGAKIAAAALGTAAVVGGTAYAMKKGAAAQDKFMQGLVDSARRAQAEREDLRRTSDNIRSTLNRARDIQNNYRFNERDVDNYFMGNDRRDANQSFKDFNRRAGDANRSLGEAEARAREYRKGIQDNMRRLDDMENVMNRIEEEMRRRNNGR